MDYLIIVHAKTRLEQLIARYNTRAQARFYIERQGVDFSDYEAEHERYYQALSQVERQLNGRYKYKLLERALVPQFLFAPAQIVLVVGQDGLVANTAKYALDNPILAINPDPMRYDGVLLPFRVDNFVPALRSVITKAYRARAIHFAEARLQDGQRLLAFNELFVGAKSHISARYQLTYRGAREEQSSSGLLIATQAGSTAWLSSVFNMVNGLCATFGADVRLSHPQLDTDQLFFTVREPFQSLQSTCEHLAGVIGPTEQLQLVSRLPQQGVIFSDGIEQDCLEFNAGAVATIAVAKEQATLVCPLR